jgi:hypothetical protein
MIRISENLANPVNPVKMLFNIRVKRIIGIILLFGCFYEEELIIVYVLTLTLSLT